MFSIPQHNSLLLDDDSQDFILETNTVFVDQLQQLTFGEAEILSPGGILEIEPDGKVNTFGNIKLNSKGYKPAIFELLSQNDATACVTFPKTIKLNWIDENPDWNFQFEWILPQQSSSLKLRLKAGQSIFLEAGMRLVLSLSSQKQKLFGAVVPFDIKTTLT